MKITDVKPGESYAWTPYVSIYSGSVYRFDCTGIEVVEETTRGYRGKTRRVRRAVGILHRHGNGKSVQENATVEARNLLYTWEAEERRQAHAAEAAERKAAERAAALQAKADRRAAAERLRAYLDAVTDATIRRTGDPEGGGLRVADLRLLLEAVDA